MTDTLDALLYQCTVQLNLADGTGGTGFLVAPGYVLTCEHVVRGAEGEAIQLRWQNKLDFATGYVEKVFPDIDVALVWFEPPRADLPCVYFDDRDVRVGDRLYLFGYTDDPDYPTGRPVTPECEGFTGDDPPLIMLEQGQIQPGMSGAALLNRETGQVCGMAKFTRSMGSDLGGGGVKASVILAALPQLRDWQQAFHQGDDRWRRCMESPVAPCPNNLPRSGSVNFVGRETELLEIHTQLHRADRLAITAIQGMGGIGKTELTLQYAQIHRRRGNYPGGICWLSAREQEVGSEIVRFALTELGLSVPQDLDLEAQVRYCWSRWPGDGDVLVVFDDVAGPDDRAAYRAIQPYLPPQDGRFWVLLTTRLQLSASVQSLQIEVLSEAAALALLKSEELVGPARVAQEPDTAIKLVKWLGYLPLGLELVGRFLSRKRSWTLAKMLERLQEKRLQARALNQAQPDMTATHESAAAAFELSWQELKPEVQQLAYVLCLYGLAPIAWEWIEAWYENTNVEKLERWRDEGLVSRSLLNPVDVEKQTFQLHQLTREFFRAKIDSSCGTKVYRKFPKLIQQFFSTKADRLKCRYTVMMVAVAKEISNSLTQEKVLQITPFVPHLMEAASTWQLWLEDDSLTWPFIGLGRFYGGQGAYGQALPWYEACLLSTRKRFGDEHSSVALSLNNLALLYDNQGRYSEAEPLYVEALAMSKRLLGDEHPDVASSLNNLAVLYKNQGRYGEAEPLYAEAAEIFEQQLGEKHPNTQTVLGNFYAFLEKVIAAGQDQTMSHHPRTQALLLHIKSQTPPA